MDEYSALRTAAYNGRDSVLSLLLPLLPPYLGSYIKDALLVIAAGQGHTQVVMLLLDGTEGVPSASKDAALLAAARCGSWELVDMLIQCGADVHAQGDLALREAAEYDDQNHKAVVQLLLQKGADVHTHHDSPLLAAAAHGHTDVVQLLVSTGL